MKDAFVAQGPHSIPDLIELRRQARELRSKLAIESAPEYANSSWWKKWVINFQINREVARRMDPRYRLYAQ